MGDVAFNPREAEVNSGATVRWVNKDSVEHDVTSAQFSDGATAWDFKQTLGGDQSTTHQFDSEGIYEYKCTIHGENTMCGVVLVGDVSYDGSLPCGDGGSDGGGY
jgi:plastocyanin